MKVIGVFVEICLENNKFMLVSWFLEKKFLFGDFLREVFLFGDFVGDLGKFVVIEF